MERNILTPLKRFFNLLKVDKQDLFSVYIYALFNGIVGLSIPLGIQAIINFITAGEVSTSWIILVIIVIIGIAFSGVLQIMQLTITENLQQKIFTRSAFEFAYRIPRIKFSAVDDKYVPELVNRFFDTLSVQKGLSKIIMDFSTATLQIVFGLILLSLYHPFFIMFSFILLLIVYLIFKYTTPKGIITSLKESTFKYEVAHWLEEIARVNSTFKLAGETDLPLTKTDEKVQGYLTYRKAHFKTLLVQYINLVGFKILIAAGLLIIGGLLVINQQMNIGQFVASEIIIILVLASVEKLILSMETIYDVLTAIEKIGLVTDLELERDKGEKLDKDARGLAIKTKDLSYNLIIGSQKEQILNNINFELKEGASMCVAGLSGSGKSFLLQVLSGLYDDFSGAVVVNGLPIGSLCKENLRTYIGDNLSKEDIFKGSLYENISLGKKFVNIEDVRNAAQVVGLCDYIESLPEGYNTILLSEGKNLPKILQLKIILARSIVGNPKLILLEDNFKQLPEMDRNRFINYLLDKDKKWTVIAISNEKEIASKFDKILVLSKGSQLAFDSYENVKKLKEVEIIF
ncbi:MAG: ATP-binding cassette domain-containing protein [Flavobacteriales bacterium]|nr:ATP-binding cassette domain-containing protein [Flavobacteriales bacterium]